MSTTTEPPGTTYERQPPVNASTALLFAVLRDIAIIVAVIVYCINSL